MSALTIVLLIVMVLAILWQPTENNYKWGVRIILIIVFVVWLLDILKIIHV